MVTKAGETFYLKVVSPSQYSLKPREGLVRRYISGKANAMCKGSAERPCGICVFTFLEFGD